MLTLSQLLYFSTLIFLIGLWGLTLNKKNIITILMSIELLLLGSNLNFIIFSSFIDDLQGQLFSLLILTAAAAESAVGLAILIVFYKKYQVVNFEYTYNLYG